MGWAGGCRSCAVRRAVRGGVLTALDALQNNRAEAVVTDANNAPSPPGIRFQAALLGDCWGGLHTGPPERTEHASPDPHMGVRRHLDRLHVTREAGVQCAVF